MALAEWLLVLHVVVFALWFGTDLATFTLSRRVVNPDQSSRAVLAGAMMSIEVFARLCLPLALGTGVLAAEERGWIDIGSWAVVLGVACAAWSGAVWSIHRGHDVLVRPDLVVRSLVAVTAWVVGVGSLVGDSFLPTEWLGVKMLCFATIVSCGIAIRFQLRPFGPAFAAIAASGSTPELEAVVTRSIRRAQPFVVLIWASLLVAATMGVAGPTL